MGEQPNPGVGDGGHRAHRFGFTVAQHDTAVPWRKHTLARYAPPVPRRAPRPTAPAGDPAVFVASLPPPAEQPTLEIPPTTSPEVRERLLDALADEGARTPAVAAVAAALRDRERIRLYREPETREVLEGLLRGLHELVEYTPDPGRSEIFNRAVVTLAPAHGKPLSELTKRPKGSGDCEDLAVLFSAWARSLGMDARPVWLDQPGRRQNHVAAVVCGGGLTARIAPDGCAWVETTLPGAYVGEHPWAAAGRLEGQGRVYGSAGALSTCASAEDRLLAGEPGSAAEVARVTATRAALIVPGVWAAGKLVGVRGWIPVLLLSLGGAIGYEAAALGLAALKRRGEVPT